MRLRRKTDMERSEIPHSQFDSSYSAIPVLPSFFLQGVDYTVGEMPFSKTEDSCNAASKADPLNMKTTVGKYGNSLLSMALLEPTPFPDILMVGTTLFSPSSSPRRIDGPRRDFDYTPVESPAVDERNQIPSRDIAARDRECTLRDKMRHQHSILHTDTRALPDRRGNKKGRMSQSHIREYQHTQWEENFLHLVEYKQENGHCDVPHRCPHNIVLSRWVKRQRHQYRLFENGKPSSMTPHRIQRLESLGFVWKIHDSLWETRFAEFVKFQNANKGSQAPATGMSRTLLTWVKQQRRQYWRFCQGLHSTITLDKIERLQSAGFVWAVRHVTRGDTSSGNNS